MIRRSWSHSRTDMQGANWGKKLGGKGRWRKGKLNFTTVAIKVTYSDVWYSDF